jgi:Tol biopolymer transport system component
VAWIVAAVAIAISAVLAFVQLRAKQLAAQVVQFQLPLPAPTSFTFGVPHVSPDGRRVAFLSGGANGRTQLWVRSLDSLESRPLAGTEGVFNTAFWSPDSRSLGFVAEGRLKKVDASGGQPQTLCDLPAAITAPGQRGTFRAGAWSRDGVIIFGTSLAATRGFLPMAVP